MAKSCLVCGKTMGAFTGKVALADGYVCVDCWKKAGFGSGPSDLEKSKSYTGNDIKNILSGATSDPVRSAADLEDAIFARIKASGTSTLMQKANIKGAAAMIRANETVIAAISANASLDEPKGAIRVDALNLKNKVNGVVIVTDQKVVFVSSSGVGASKSFYLTDINAIDDCALSTAVLRIQTASTSLAIDGSKKVLSRFRAELENAMDKARSEKSQSSNVVVQQAISGADEILKYKDLLDAGIITEAEFQAKKAQILGL